MLSAQVSSAYACVSMRALLDPWLELCCPRIGGDVLSETFPEYHFPGIFINFKRNRVLFQSSKKRKRNGLLNVMLIFFERIVSNKYNHFNIRLKENLKSFTFMKYCNKKVVDIKAQI